MSRTDLFHRPDLLAAIAVILLCATAAAFFTRRYLNGRPPPEELERRRRLAIHAKGKLVAGEVLDITGDSVVYSYLIAGVHYTASQNVQDLREHFPGDGLDALGPVGVKYDPRNPANSIILCEEWSGLRRPKPRQP